MSGACRVKRCRARVHTVGDEVTHRWSCHVGHIGNAAAVKVTQVMTQLIQIAENCANAPKIVVADCLSVDPQSAIAALPIVDHLKRNVQHVRERNSNRPTGRRVTTRMVEQ